MRLRDGKIAQNASKRHFSWVPETVLRSWLGMGEVELGRYLEAGVMARALRGRCKMLRVPWGSGIASFTSGRVDPDVPMFRTHHVAEMLGLALSGVKSSVRRRQFVPWKGVYTSPVEARFCLWDVQGYVWTRQKNNPIEGMRIVNALTGTRHGGLLVGLRSPAAARDLKRLEWLFHPNENGEGEREERRARYFELARLHKRATVALLRARERRGGTEAEAVASKLEEVTREIRDRMLGMSEWAKGNTGRRHA